MDAVATLDALNEMVAAGVVRGSVDKVEARLVDGDRVGGHQDADVGHARVLGNGAAVTVDRHVLHDIDVGNAAALSEEVDHRARSIGHGLKELVVIGRPDILGHCDAVDVRLAVGRSHTDRELLERAAETSHGMALEVRQHQHRVVLGQVLAHEVLLEAQAIRDGQLKVGALGIHEVDVEVIVPSMLGNRAQVLLGRVALSVVGRVALNDRAMQLAYHGRPKVRVQEVLVAHLAGMDFNGNLTRQFDAKQAIEFDDLFGRDCAGEINLGLVSHDAFPSLGRCGDADDSI